MEKTQPILSLRPQFDQALTMVYALAAGAVGTLLMTTVGGLFLYVLFMILGLARFISPGYVFGLVLVCSIVAIPALFFDARKRSLQRTVFNFHPGHIEYQYFHWHLGRRRGRLNYDDITDISQRASAIQEQRGLTTIYIYAPVMETRQKGFPGLEIVDLPQPRDDLNRIMQVIDNDRAAAAQALMQQQAAAIAAAAAVTAPPAAETVTPPPDDNLSLPR